MANETWEKHTMIMDDAEYDAVAAAITKALLEQEIKELLEEHEKMDDTDDNDALLLAIITLGLVCIVVVATCCCCGLLYCLVKCIRKRRNKKPQNIIIINEEERMKRRMKALERFGHGNSAGISSTASDYGDEGEHTLVPTHQTREGTLRQRTTAQCPSGRRPSKQIRRSHSPREFSKEEKTAANNAMKADEGWEDKNYGRNDGTVPKESRERTRIAIEKMMAAKKNQEIVDAKNKAFLAKNRKLIKQKEEVDDEDKEENLFSDSYTRRAPRPRVTLLVEAKPQDERTHDAIEAFIFRIMKEQRTVTHYYLLGLVQSRLAQLNPREEEIKNAIETLIGKGYLERSVDDSQRLRYNWITLS